jgi:hypothetical protein
MDGTFVKELDAHFARPDRINEFVAMPPGWTLHDQVALVKPGPVAEKLAVYSLGALRDYILANRDALPLERLVVHVVSPNIVRLLGPLNMRSRDREVFVEALAMNLLDNFVGKWMPQEDFIIGLQTRFDSSLDRNLVLQFASTMTHEAVNTSADDGIGQTVTAKAGVALRATVPVPNPVKLVPFRTFREVQQPDSLFVLRVNPQTQLGLFEADGGAWRLQAIERIGVWLTQELRETKDIAILA